MSVYIQYKIICICDLFSFTKRILYKFGLLLASLCKLSNTEITMRGYYEKYLTKKKFPERMNVGPNLYPAVLRLHSCLTERYLSYFALSKWGLMWSLRGGGGGGRWRGGAVCGECAETTGARRCDRLWSHWSSGLLGKQCSWVNCAVDLHRHTDTGCSVSGDAQGQILFAFCLSVVELEVHRFRKVGSHGQQVLLKGLLH